MSELSLVLIRFGYLAVLWIFVLATISVIRTDMFGARAPEAGQRQSAAPAGRKRARPVPSRQAAARRPDHVAIVEGGNAGEVSRWPAPRC